MAELLEAECNDFLADARSQMTLFPLPQIVPGLLGDLYAVGSLGIGVFDVLDGPLAIFLKGMIWVEVGVERCRVAASSDLT